MKLIKKNKVISTILAVAIALSMILGPALDTQAAGWKSNNVGWWYEKADGSYAVSEWELINGTWYYFDASGYMVTEWKQIGGIWYYFEASGAMTTGWKYLGGIWYYMDESGAMVTGWKVVNGTWYYFDGSGAMAKDTWVGGYYVDSSGAWNGSASAGSSNVSGWVLKGSKWYYYNTDGTPHSGWIEYGSDWYYTDADGGVHSGWVQSGADWYYTNSEGLMQTGWITDGGTSYLMGTDGKWISNPNKIIYLTFDDGPGPYTDRLLGILSKYNVKATFFVTNTNSGYASCIGKAYNQGHAIGVHSYSHNYNKIYASDTAFWSDFDSMNSVIEAQTGSKSKIFRFPGGSSNTVSSFNTGIMTKLTAQASTKGYKYFDWNVSSEDAAGATTSKAVYENIKSGVQSRSTSVVLCHDIKSYTVDAMEDFIPWAQANGYTFMTINENTPVVHHTVNN